MYRVHVNNYIEETDPEKIFRLKMTTNWGEDTFSLLKYVGGDPKLFSGMGIDDQGRLFRKKHGWWFADGWSGRRITCSRVYSPRHWHNSDALNSSQYK